MTQLPELLADEQRKALAAGIDAIMLVERMIHQLEFLRAQGFASLNELASRIARAEQHADHGEHLHRAIEADVAAATHTTSALTAARMGHAAELIASYPAVSAALAEGDISLRHTEIIAEAGQIVAAFSARQSYEAAVLPLALAMTPPQLRAHARRLAEHYSEQSLDERHATARETRCVRVTPLNDGMAKLIAVLAATEAYAIKDRLVRLTHETRTQGAVAAPQAPAREAAYEATRAHTQADIFAQLLLGDGALTGATRTDHGRGHTAGSLTPDLLARVTGHVQVTVPVFTLARFAHPKAAPYAGPAELEGYGPIDSETARRIAGHSSGWSRILTHPHTGDVLAVDRYRPSEHQKRLLIARDEHCRFPGCTRPAINSDIDHTIDAQRGGHTSIENLGHLCRYHHTMKHTSLPGFAGWSVKQTPDGSYHWRAPSGRKYITTPASRVRFSPVSPQVPPRPQVPAPNTGDSGSGSRSGSAAEPDPP